MFPEDGKYIDNQADFSASSLSFGGETIAECGCGVVAAYNVLISRGLRISFYQVYKYSCHIHSTSGGLNRDEIISIITHFDPTISLSGSTPFAVLVFHYMYDSSKKDGDIYLGGHVQAGNYIEGEKFYMHNATNKDSYSFLANISSYCSYLETYCGYYIEGGSKHYYHSYVKADKLY